MTNTGRVESSTAAAIRDLSDTLRLGLARMGTADAATPLGATEVLAQAIMSGSETIASALNDLAAAIRERSA